MRVDDRQQAWFTIVINKGVQDMTTFDLPAAALPHIRQDLENSLEALANYTSCGWTGAKLRCFVKTHIVTVRHLSRTLGEPVNEAAIEEISRAVGLRGC
jgi:hypothetical protein